MPSWPITGGDAWRLYEYITRHFIATVSYDCKYLQTTISFRIGPELFTCSGKTVLSPGRAMYPRDSLCTLLPTTCPVRGRRQEATVLAKPHCISPGFTEIMPWQSVPLEESLPTCQRGDIFPVAEVKMLEKQTNPPDYLTEAELITLMEKHGIGGCTCCCPRPRGQGGYTYRHSLGQRSLTSDL